jgi:hypothetical protein
MSDDTMILYFYGEAEDPEAIRALLAESAELRERYEILCRTLEAAREGLPVPERPDSFGADMWARIEPRLSEATPSDDRVLPFPVPSRRARWTWAGLAAAAVLLLVMGFLAGRSWRPAADAPRVAEETGLSAAARQRILVRAVAMHLERSERLFTELENAPAEGPVDLSAERQWAEDLLTANRLYRQSSRQGGRPGLASLLDELEPFLLELSHAPTEIPADDLADFRARLEEQTLLFKMRIVSRRIDQSTL